MEYLRMFFTNTKNSLRNTYGVLKSTTSKIRFVVLLPIRGGVHLLHLKWIFSLVVTLGHTFMATLEKMQLLKPLLKPLVPITRCKSNLH